MTPEEILVSHLLADSDLVALVSQRIYPLAAPQDAMMPAIAYQRVGTRVAQAHDGASYTDVRFQLSCLSDSYAGARALADAVSACANGRRGSAAGKSYVVFLEQVMDGYVDLEARAAPLVRLELRMLVF